MFKTKTSDIKEKHLLTRYKSSDDRKFNKQKLFIRHRHIELQRAE